MPPQLRGTNSCCLRPRQPAIAGSHWCIDQWHTGSHHVARDTLIVCDSRTASKDWNGIVVSHHATMKAAQRPPSSVVDSIAVCHFTGSHAAANSTNADVFCSDGLRSFSDNKRMNLNDPVLMQSPTFERPLSSLPIARCKFPDLQDHHRTLDITRCLFRRSEQSFIARRGRRNGVAADPQSCASVARTG